MKNKAILCGLLSALILPFLSGCNTDNSKVITLRIYNAGDYIYDPETPEDYMFYDEEETQKIPSICDQFIEYYETNHPGYKLEIEYSTFDTLETMYTKLETGSSQYDLVCPSDYTIQKMMRNGMVEKIENIKEKIPNYFEYCSPYLMDIFEENGWTDYSIGYMWGTVGLTYNPEKVDEDDIASWKILLDDTYYKKGQIKDSVRETYMIGLIYAYYDEIMELKARNTLEDTDPNYLTDKAYNTELTEIFNRHDEETVKKVEEQLNVLKTKIYGYEVDSGKNDIAKGTIDINCAWSGDAVYSMDTALEDEENPIQLKFSVPEEGSNIWFDGWVIPKGGDVDLACEFLNFISDPEIAYENMWYIGYTPFIAGDYILDQIWDCYGDVESEDEDCRLVDLNYFFNGSLSNEYLEEHPLESDNRMIIRTSDEEGTQIDTQYPSLEVVTRCTLMKDFGDEGNIAMSQMWERVRSNDIQPWIIIVFLVFVALIIALVLILKAVRQIERKRRKRLK